MVSQLGGRQPKVDPRVSILVNDVAVSEDDVRLVTMKVLESEHAGEVLLSVTFLSSQRMRVLNRRTFDKDRSTDVIAFPMKHQDTLTGDIYICPAWARRTAARLGISEREELVRLIVHGTLHVLGHEHPNGPSRTSSAMWRLQEKYVAMSLSAAPCNECSD